MILRGKEFSSVSDWDQKRKLLMMHLLLCFSSVPDHHFGNSFESYYIIQIVYAFLWFAIWNQYVVRPLETLWMKILGVLLGPTYYLIFILGENIAR